MPDTVRKKKLTIKSQRPAMAGGDGQAIPTAQAPAAQQAVPVPMNPMDMQQVVKTPSYTVYAILALIAVICYVALLLLQYMELAHYAEPPSLWPLR